VSNPSSGGEPRAATAPAAVSSRDLIGLALALCAQIALAAWTAATAINGSLTNLLVGDVVARYVRIAPIDAPWVSEPVEFPPLGVAVIEPLAWVTERGNILAVHMIIQGMLLLILWAVVWYGWGVRGLRRLLFWTLPMLPILLLRIDAMSLALVAVALILARRDRPVGTGVAIAAGVLAKVWPGVLVLTLARRQWKAAVAGVVATGVGTLVWMALTTADAPLQVLGFRGAKGWHMESVAGTVVRLIDGGTPDLEQGAWRFGDASWVLTVALGVVAVAIVVWACGRIAAPERQLLVALPVVLIASPLLSVQYAAWLALPLALAETHWDEKVTGWIVVASSFGILWYLGDAVDGAGAGYLLLLLRNALLLVLAAQLLWRTASGPRPQVAADVIS
jgi:hypothetical protein